MAAKTSKNIPMRAVIAHFPFVTPLNTFDFTYQPYIHRR